MGLQVSEGPSMALVRVVVQQLLDQLFCLLVVDKLWEFKLTLHYFFIYIIGSLSRISKGQNPTEKLIQADPQRPQIDQIIIPLAQDDIRSHIMRGSDNCKGFANLIILSPDDLARR